MPSTDRFLSRGLLLLAAALAWALVACGGAEPSGPVTELRHYPVDDTDGLVTRSGVVLDREVSSDGNGSLRVTFTEPATIRLYETGDLDVENARLTYRAKIRTADLEGRVYLEMWCVFLGRGEYFSRDLGTPVTGTQEWSTEETPFFLETGDNPDNVKLNLVVEGTGTVWIDDVRLLEGPLG